VQRDDVIDNNWFIALEKVRLESSSVQAAEAEPS
jgi:hypothetical protein